MEVFSTRELVFIIYLTILAFWVIAKKVSEIRFLI